VSRVRGAIRIVALHLVTLGTVSSEPETLRAALEELVEAHDYWFSTGKGEGRAITATAKAKELLS